MLSHMIPPFCDNDRSVNLLRELCSIVASTRVSVSSSHGDFEKIFDFTCKCIDAYGGVIEKGLIASLSGISSPRIYLEVRRILETLITENVTSVKGSLGSVWTLPREQKNGQDAFESKPTPKPHYVLRSADSLGSVFTMLTKCLCKCPLLAVNLPATPVCESESDSLLRRAVDSAVDSLSTGDPLITSNAISFLKSLVSLLCFVTDSVLSCLNRLCRHPFCTIKAEHRFSTYDVLQSFVIDALSRIQEDCVIRLIGLSCAKVEFNRLSDVADLLLVFLRTTKFSDIKGILISSFHQDYFLLGEAASDAGLITLLRWSEGGNQVHHDECRTFLEAIWNLHQVEDTDSLPGSDRVALFVGMYS
jgi:hypothetical protein